MQFNQVELQLPAQKYKQNQMDEGEKIYQNGTPSINDNYYEGKDEDQFGVDQNGDSEQEKSTSKATPDNMSKSESIIEVNPSNKKQAKSSTMYAYMNLFKGYIGSGILALPYAFTQAGWVLSSMIFLLVAFIVYDTMNLLFELADSYGKEGVDYQFIAKHHFGRKGQFAVSTFIVIFQVGCCISYVIFFMKFLENVFGMAGKTQENDIIYLLIALAIIIPMSFINSISAFAKISILANFMIVVTLLAIFSYNIQKIGELQPDIYSRNLNDTFDFSRIPMMIGVSIYAFEAIGLIFSIRNSVENPQLQFGAIFRNTNIVMVSVYIVFSVVAVIAYGDDMNEIILFSLPNDQKSVQFFQIIYAFALIMSYPLQLLPTFQILESNQKIHKFIYQQRAMPDNSNKEPCSTIARRMVMRVSVTLCICFCAYAVPRFAIFLNIIGAVAGTSLQFILPIIMYLQTFKDTMKTFKKFKLYIFFLIGVIGGLSSFIFSVIELAQQREATETDNN
ncbi:transmembrane amino acid transporter protein (macronuclear) [Tetrahymena thermophila SB210]|uniref:Transmembrane amino acid transporter protein n=1 Tax=Tetrahymena thermophila (strain SB210) TaxID=312017 RepID=Q24FU6_TETTS|nr:transmembrane amino acid transporter protein [Tetrahymena thermophila SB210]EAS06664.2 transmembrane amino acid transporter protein [Tetrahymena thermophila SB210]|eukprot:XP_001026909.2 transmembrane amino acid transporter protein [Tetrahymena thermophila SB210]